MDRVEKYDAFDIAIACLHYDDSFNCRGEFTAQSVHELSLSIAARGLDFPLVVQPAADVEGGLPAGCQYRLMCGHRRFKAITTFLSWTSVPCTVRRGLSDREARLLNLTENLERHDLNRLEEALAIGRMYPAGTALAAIAYELKRSIPWVKYRLEILKLPPQLQQCVAAGRLKMNDIRLLVTLPDMERDEAARVMMREGRSSFSARKPCRIGKKRKSQINRMIERLFEAGLSGLCTRLLAWTTGAVTDEEMISEIERQSGQSSVPSRDANGRTTGQVSAP